MFNIMISLLIKNSKLWGEFYFSLNYEVGRYENKNDLIVYGENDAEDLCCLKSKFNS